MKRLTLLVPLIGLTAFGSYYHHWDGELQARAALDARHPLAHYARRSGQADAEQDLVRGRRRLLTCGEPAVWHKEYNGLLHRIYRIEVESLTADPNQEFVESYATDYNAVMRRDAAAVFGPDIFRRTQTLAEHTHTVNVRITGYISPL